MGFNVEKGITKGCPIKPKYQLLKQLLLLMRSYFFYKESHWICCLKSSFLHMHTKQKYSFFFFFLLSYTVERELDLRTVPTRATMSTQYWPAGKTATLWIISFTSCARNCTLPRKTLETPVSRTDQVQPLLVFQTWWDHSWRTHAWNSYFLLQHHVECYQFYQHIP